MIPKKFSIKKIPSYGPYNTCVFIGGFLFVSGQIAIDQNTEKLVSYSIEMETKKIMENIKIILSENGIGFENVIKTSVFVTDINFFPKINHIYAQFFHKGSYPARETIEVSGLPKDANVEISLIAYKN
ncbi:Rid family detoxifying hydrolase [Blattabacterium cuenoti]|uniref:Endoribonuclease, L-PSP family n=1 Tax=Blattabacterium cuenoti STAT TaxID=1457030 RepID=A0A224AHU7_9FLAO|nr:Rid family detoxifying hydrolase [Blattabacterium cuenoti]BBA16963.1 endoribonuclease, L-PSP family [Blattabacterium cuenoti STAT]